MYLYLCAFLDDGYCVGTAVQYTSAALGGFEIKYDDALGNEIVNTYQEMPLYYRGDTTQFLNVPN